jgi:type I restriction enzyme S subunit
MRIEAEYYDPEKLRRLSWLQPWRNRSKDLEELCEFITDGTHVTPNYVDRGVRFLSSKNILVGCIDFEDTKLITPAEHEVLGRGRCNPAVGDILLSKNGKIGTAASYLTGQPPCSLFVSVALLRYKGVLDRDYVVAFLNSNGGWHQFARSAKTGVITNLHLEEIREVVVPQPHPDAQRYIGDKVRQAERLRERARKLRVDIAKAFSDVGFGEAVVPGERIARISISELADRLDALHYRADLLRNLESIRRHQTVPLGSRVDFDGLADGDHGNPTYGQGPIYVRATELTGGILDTGTDVRLDEVYASRVSTSAWATSDDVLFSIVATLGAVGVLEEGSRAVLSRGVAKVRPVTLPKHYVKAYMRTTTFSSELLRRSVGTIQRGVYLESLQGLEVPVLPQTAVDIIAAKEAAADRCIVALRSLTCASKLFVERLIDGVISESDLVAAQKALESGDRSADRALLNALRRSDAPDAPPLFADVDGFYELLDDEDINRGAD